MGTENGNGVDATEPVRTGTRPRRRATAQPSPKPAKRSLNLRIDADCYERLAIHALKKKTTISALVELLAREHLREYFITRNSRAGASEGGEPAGT